MSLPLFIPILLGTLLPACKDAGRHCNDFSMNYDSFPTKYWSPINDGRVECTVCPRSCKLKAGQRGLCFVRGNEEGKIVLKTYGRSSGFCIDPVEKKPLHHFLPGTPILSFGTAGCNLSCQFCQNWDITKTREMDRLADQASPEAIAAAAKRYGCRSVAFTYNDPIVFLEYAVDTAVACRQEEIRTVAVTSGYICEEPRKEFFNHMDAANVDLKGFTDRFYSKHCAGELAPVLETLVYLKKETNVWLEITTLLIPGENDSEKEIEEETQWIFKNLGPDVPLHFTAFHPDYRMRDTGHTSPESLTTARNIAIKNGLLFVYTGNVHDMAGGSTYCPGCQQKVIGRDWHVLTDYNLTESGFCSKCGTEIPGVFEENPGNWGAKRRPVFIGNAQKRT